MDLPAAARSDPPGRTGDKKEGQRGSDAEQTHRGGRPRVSAWTYLYVDRSYSRRSRAAGDNVCERCKKRTAARLPEVKSIFGRQHFAASPASPVSLLVVPPSPSPPRRRRVVESVACVLGSASSAAFPAAMSYYCPLAVLLFDGVARTDVGTMLRPARAGGRYNFLATGRSILTSRLLFSPLASSRADHYSITRRPDPMDFPLITTCETKRRISRVWRLSNSSA